jgi:lambda family phage minor tail protein L
MNIRELVTKLTPDAEIELFEFDLSPITGTSGPSDHIYMHPGTTVASLPVVWQTKTYNPFPIDAEGWEMNAKGTLPRPTIRVANVTGIITALVLDHDDLIGARVIRRRTFARYLDGAAEADPNAHLPDDIFFVERKITENPVFVSFELASAMDLEGFQIPARSVIANYCPWIYRSAECSYAGSSYFDINNFPVGLLSQDVCNKLTTGCKARFGTTAVLPFGGFPASRAYKL